MRALITGSRGFIGRQTVEPLHRAGFEVHCASRGPGDVPGVMWHTVDLLDPLQRRALVDKVKPTHLLHLAWCTDHGQFWSDPRNVDWAAATLDLAVAFHDSGGRRLVVAGTCAEYDWTEGGSAVLHETDSPRRPKTLYGQAKLSTQELLSAYSHHVGLSFGWGVLFYSLGPCENPSRLVPSIILSLLGGRVVTVEAPDLVRDVLDVRDVGAALATLLGSDVEGRVNVACGSGVSLGAISSELGRLLGRDDLVHLGRGRGAGAEPIELGANVERLRREVGFIPQHGLADGLSFAVDWWRSHTGMVGPAPGP